MKKIISLLLAAWVLLPCLAIAAELELAKDGKTSYTIVTPDNPPQLERLAAADLQYFLKQVTGADFKIVKKPIDKITSYITAASQLFRGFNL